MFKHLLIGLATAGALSAGISNVALGSDAGSADVIIDGIDIATEIHAIGNGELRFRSFGRHQRNHVIVGSCPAGTELETVVFTGPGLNLDVPRCN